MRCRVVINLVILVVVILCIRQSHAERDVHLTSDDRRSPNEKDAFVIGNGVEHSGTENNTGHGEASHGIHVASWRWDYVRIPLLTTLFIIITGWCKIAFHHGGILAKHVPESCVLIVLGTLVGLVVFFTGSTRQFPIFTDTLFFLYLLPPIVLESGYSLHNRVFSDNLGTVLVYAVIGTLINIFTIGPALYGLSAAGAMGDLQLPLRLCLTFSSLIAAVDPVAVLAIFQELGVNNMLYFLVFGESLLNDAVTVVLYNVMTAFLKMDQIDATQIGLGIASFFTVSLGGLLIGLIHGFITSLSTKYTEHVRVVEPLLMLGLAYSSYLVAELFHFSGIISIIACAIVQAEYAVNNISFKSATAVKVNSKMLSAAADMIIFLFLGLALVHDHHIWHTGFVLWTIFLCLIFRFATTFLLSYLVNRVDLSKAIHIEDMFITSYGGLRGAVCFSLAASLSVPDPYYNMILTTTMAVIIFTVFVQGITIKPLVKLFRIQLKHKDKRMFDELNQALLDHTSAGIEEVIGHYGRQWLREAFTHINVTYFKPLLQSSPDKDTNQIMAAYEKMLMKQHFASLPGSKVAQENSKDVKDTLKSGEVEKHLQGMHTLLQGIAGINSTDDEAASVEPPTKRQQSRYIPFTPVTPQPRAMTVYDVWNLFHQENKRNTLHFPRSMANRNQYQDRAHELASQMRKRHNRVKGLSALPCPETSGIPDYTRVMSDPGSDQRPLSMPAGVPLLKAPLAETEDIDKKTKTAKAKYQRGITLAMGELRHKDSVDEVLDIILD